MATLGGIIFLFLAFAGIVLIIMAAYAMRWSAIEARVRKSLETEFQLKAEEESRLLIKERKERDERWKKSEEDLAEHIKKYSDQANQYSKQISDLNKENIEIQNYSEMKIQEAKESHIQEGRIQAKKQILQTLNFVIQSHYSSNQIKTKLSNFVKKFEEQLQF